MPRFNINCQDPTTVEKNMWLTWKNFTGINAARPTDNGGGCFLVFVDECDIDERWEDIRIATGAGLLGYASSVCSAGKNAWFAEYHELEYAKYVICVKTYDCDDWNDSMRVRKALFNMGITWPLKYKTQEETILDSQFYRSFCQE